MKVRERFLLAPASILVAAGAVACANVQVVAPQDRDSERSRVYNSAYDRTWTRAVDWFADHNVTIDKIEKESGLITARFKIRVGQEFLDCGDIRVSGVLGPGEIERFGALNLTVRTISNDKSKVSVNFFGEWSLEDYDLWDGRPVVRHGHCVSTGELERSVLDFVEK